MKTTQAKSGWLVVGFCCGASLVVGSALEAADPSTWLAVSAILGQTTTVEGDVDQLLRQARQAMQAGDLAEAERLVVRAESQAEKSELRFLPLTDSPAKVRRDLEKLKRPQRGLLSRILPGGRSANSELSDLPTLPPVEDSAAGGPVTARLSDDGPAIISPLPPTGLGPAGPSTPAAPVVTRQQLQSAAGAASDSSPIDQARRLVTQSRQALQQGDIAAAEQFARQAVALRVPDEQFGKQDVLPWQMLMEVNKERQRRGPGAVAAGSPPSQVSSGLVTPAQFLGQPDELELAPIRSDDDSPLAAPPDEPRSALEGSQSAEQLVAQADEAIKQQRYDDARNLLTQAWARRGELDPETQQRIQDQLQSFHAANRIPRPLAETVPPADPKLQQLYQRINTQEAEARRTLTKTPLQSWEAVRALKGEVSQADIDPTAKGQLQARLDRTLAEMDRFIQANRGQIELDEHNRRVLQEVDEYRRLKVEIDEKLASMVEHFNQLMDEQRFAEAVVIAKQARDLDPENPVVQNMLWQSRFAERLVNSMRLSEDGQIGFDRALSNVIASAVPFDDSYPIIFPRNWEDINVVRGRTGREEGRQLSPSELQIYRALRTTQVLVQFENQALSDVIKTLQTLAGINIHLDPEGIGSQGITGDQTININLPNPISLESALRLILEPFGLHYVVQNEVLRITSREFSNAGQITLPYQVADLVIPIPNFVPTYYMGMAGALREAHNLLGYGPTGMGGMGPLAILADDQTPATNGTLASSMLAQQRGGAGGTFPLNAPSAPNMLGMGPGGLGGGGAADFDSLIELVTNTIAPDTWSEYGGTGTIEPFPGNLSIVVSNRQDVHDQIRDLLEQLRRLQDLQVTIEVRFLTLNDNFFERIGVDFDFDIDDNVAALPPEDGGPAVTIGLDPLTGEPTADLDLSFTQGSFISAIPPAFAGFDPGTAANFGFAILSDIEAFFVIQAAQGDSRTNVLQAPKVTLFNGQLATITDTTSRAFVSSVVPVVGDFAVAHQPVVMVLNEGTSLSVQAVVSNDRRFVRLTLVPMFSKIDDIQEFTFDGRRTSDTGTTAVDPTDPERTVTNDATETVEGVTIQLPTFSFTSVSTTVSVPDGGTVLLGGIKRMSEGRNERGVPVLDKLPYINRLFKNVGIGRTTQSLMMMVTPRIIIQEEEEAKLGMPPATP